LKFKPEAEMAKPKIDTEIGKKAAIAARNPN
jgi:hypothetical protein